MGMLACICKEALQLVVQKAAGLGGVYLIYTADTWQRKSGWTGVHTDGIYVELVHGKESQVEQEYSSHENCLLLQGGNPHLQ